MTFQKGKSGNPAGRPLGVRDKRTAFRTLLEPHAEELVQKAVELAKQGDTTALRICIDRIIPVMKAKDTSRTRSVHPVRQVCRQRVNGLTSGD